MSTGLIEGVSTHAPCRDIISSLIDNKVGVNDV